MSRSVRFVCSIRRGIPSIAKALATRPLDPLTILNALADSCSCTRAENAAFWILTSAGAYINGYNLDDGEGSTVEAWLRYMERAA